MPVRRLRRALAPNDAVAKKRRGYRPRRPEPAPNRLIRGEPHAVHAHHRAAADCTGPRLQRRHQRLPERLKVRRALREIDAAVVGRVNRQRSINRRRRERRRLASKHRGGHRGRPRDVHAPEPTRERVAAAASTSDLTVI